MLDKMAGIILQGVLAFGVKLRDDRQGIIAIMAALLGTVLIGGSALAVDISYWRFRQEQLQVAADAASASAIYDIQNGTTSQAALLANTQAEAERDGCGTCTVTVTYPYNGNSTEVQVELTDAHVRRFFSSMYGSGSRILTGRSVAGEGTGGTTTTTSTNSRFDTACVLALNTWGTDVDATNGASSSNPNGVTNPNCEVIANSTSSSAFDIENNSEIAGKATTPGGIVQRNNWTYVGKPNAGAPAVADPYASIVSLPSSKAGPCSDPQSGGQSQPLNINGSSPLSSQGSTVFTNTGGNNWSVSGGGHWCKGMNLSGITLDMGPGLYIIDGNFGLSNTTINATGSGGVTIVLGVSGGNFNMNTSSSTINITAPPQNASYGIPGIAMMNYTDDPGGRTIYINNNTSINFTGTIYFPKYTLYTQSATALNAISGVNGCGHVVVGALTMTNAVAVGNNCTLAMGVQPMGSSYSSSKWGTTTTTTTTGSGTSKPILIQ